MKQKKIFKQASPWFFFLGVISGLVLCSAVGFFLSEKSWFEHFIRFHVGIGPQEKYFPTAKELLATAQHYVSKDKILVLVGGSSIFRGAGQNEDDLWTNELQNFLGTKYKVLNYANDSATTGSFGAVAFRMLIEKYSKIIFISTCGLDGGSIDGTDPYKYIFWDAYYKKLFHPDEEEIKHIKALRQEEVKTEEGLNLQIMSYLDKIFYFKNLWNYVSYHGFFTVWSDLAFSTPFKPKVHYKDLPLNYAQIMQNSIKREQVKQLAEKLSVELPAQLDEKDNLNSSIVAASTNSFDTLFSVRYRGKMLCVIPNFNPVYRDPLPPKAKNANQIILRDNVNLLKAIGYNAILINSLKAEDYGDFQHFLSAGGKKAAAIIAPEITRIARDNGYF